MKVFLATLISLLLSLAVLLILLLQYHLAHIKARGELMLCLKEAKGELHQFILHTEKLNWAIKNIDKAKYLILIPGLQAAAINSQKAKELIMKYQDLTLAHYLVKVTRLQQRCSQNPQVFMTPYQISLKGFKRRFDGTTSWRTKWQMQIKGKFEIAQLQIAEKKDRRINSQIHYRYSIKKANAWSRLPFSWDSLPSSLAHTSI